MSKESGFTLIELAVVLFIIALLLGGLLVPLATSVEQREREDTNVIIQEVQESLYGFAVVNGRLPCPDCEAAFACASGTADDGLEDLNGNVCSVPLSMGNYVGNLPWATLNVAQFDAWGYPFTYKVTAEYSRLNAAYTAVAPCNNTTGTVSFDLCTPLSTNPNNMNISRTDGGPADVAQNIPAIVISHGKNHYSAVQSAEEIENYERPPNIFSTSTSIMGANYTGDTSNSFVFKDYTLLNNAIDFDDIMIWISPFILKNKLVEAGKLP